MRTIYVSQQTVSNWKSVSTILVFNFAKLSKLVILTNSPITFTRERRFNTAVIHLWGCVTCNASSYLRFTTNHNCCCAQCVKSWAKSYKYNLYKQLITIPGTVKSIFTPLSAISSWMSLCCSSRPNLHSASDFIPPGGHSNGKRGYQAHPWTHKKAP